MMRSAPAASAHLAEIPVPAPVPRMGTPLALLARHSFRHADRSIMLSLPLVDLDATIRLLGANYKSNGRRTVIFHAIDHSEVDSVAGCCELLHRRWRWKDN